MRSATKIQKLTLLIKRKRFVVGEPGFNMLDLQFLSHVFADLKRFVTRAFDAFERLIFFNDRFHFFFNRRKIVFSDRLIDFKIIVELLAFYWTKRQLDALFDPHNRSSHHVSCRMPHNAEGFGILLCEEFKCDFAIVGQGIIQTDLLPVDFRCDRSLRKTRSDVACNIEWGH